MEKRKTMQLVLEIEQIFMKKLKEKLGLEQIKGPLYLEKVTGLNDDLSEIETPLEFIYHGKVMQVVQSLAKWKRHTLREHKYKTGEGLVVRMNAIRKDENDESKYHSLHVDQYDWEKVITKEARTIETLKAHVKKIYEVLLETKESIKKHVLLKYDLPPEITFINSEELLKMYPDLNPEEREKAYTRKRRAIFVIGVGEKLSDGEKQGKRAPDYDDWALNGDLIMWDHINQDMIELSSMGIRVNANKIVEQHTKINATHKLHLPFHKAIINGEMPSSIGGGIGISRVDMFILEKKHINEVK